MEAYKYINIFYNFSALILLVEILAHDRQGTVYHSVTWWHHHMETFSASLSLCAGNSPVTGEFLTQRPVMRSFDIFFDLRLNKQFSKQLWGWWFEMPSRSLWCHCNELHRDCWWPGSARSQAISSHGINLIFPNYSNLSTNKVDIALWINLYWMKHGFWMRN